MSWYPFVSCLRLASRHGIERIDPWSLASTWSHFPISLLALHWFWTFGFLTKVLHLKLQRLDLRLRPWYIVRFVWDSRHLLWVGWFWGNSSCSWDFYGGCPWEEKRWLCKWSCASSFPWHTRRFVSLSWGLLTAGVSWWQKRVEFLNLRWSSRLDRWGKQGWWVFWCISGGPNWNYGNLWLRAW